MRPSRGQGSHDRLHELRIECTKHGIGIGRDDTADMLLLKLRAKQGEIFDLPTATELVGFGFYKDLPMSEAFKNNSTRSGS